MADNNSEDFLILHKELYKKFGFSKGLILQTVLNNLGEIRCSYSGLAVITGVMSKSTAEYAVKELEKEGILNVKNINSWNKIIYVDEDSEYFKYASLDKKVSKNSRPKKDLPEFVKQRVKRIMELKKEKIRNALNEQ